MFKDLWEEFEALVSSPAPAPASSSYEAIPFLIGLNYSYHVVISKILLMNPLRCVNQAYCMIVSDEIQKAIVNTLGILVANP